MMHEQPFPSRADADAHIKTHFAEHASPLLLVEQASGTCVLSGFTETPNLSLYLKTLRSRLREDNADPTLVLHYVDTTDGKQSVTLRVDELYDWYDEMHDMNSDLVLSFDYNDQNAMRLAVFASFMQATPVFVLTVQDDRIIVCLAPGAMRAELDELAQLDTDKDDIEALRLWVEDDHLVRRNDVVRERRVFEWLPVTKTRSTT